MSTSDDNLRLRENVQARLDEKTTEFDNLLKQKTQLDRDYQMLSHKVKESEKKHKATQMTIKSVYSEMSIVEQKIKVLTTELAAGVPAFCAAHSFCYIAF